MMSNLWRIRAELKFDGNVRRVHYEIESVREYAYPSLEIIFLWCRDACEKLLSELKERKADARDMECVEKEIEFLKECQADWKNRYQKKVT
jgi:hypothetical protein